MSEIDFFFISFFFFAVYIPINHTWLAVATEAGWVHEGDYLAPTVAESDKKQTVNLDQLTELSNYVVYLESTPVSAKVASS